MNTASERLLKFISKNYLSFLIAAIILGTIFIYLLMPVYGMSSVWVVPYFSGAANTNWGGEWQFASDEIINFKTIKGLDIYLYEFQKYPTSELVSYSHNMTAYLYLVKIAHLFFPFLGQVGAVVFFNYLFISE